LYHLIFIVKIKNNMTICIIGTGLTALTLAKRLVNLNIKVDILSKEKNLKIDETRTIGISKSNIEYFNKNIINIEKLIHKIKKIEVYSDNLQKEKLIDFNSDKDQLFSMLRNNKLYDIIKNSLLKNKYSKFKSYNSNDLSLIKKYEIIINCDQSNIFTKKYFNKKIIKEYNSFAYTTIISHKEILNDIATQMFTKNGILALLPLSKKQTSIVYSLYDSKNFKNENVSRLIRDKNFRYEIKKIGKINSIELKSLNSRYYYYNNILAFGDLLHKLHPLAGQGFNMTIRDIKLLLRIIRNKKDLGLQLDKSINIEFENEFKSKNFIFTKSIDLIHDFFNLERKFKSTFLSKSVQIVSNFPPINKVFKKIANVGVL